MTSSPTRLDRYVSIAACGSGVVGFAASTLQADVYHYDTPVVMSISTSTSWSSSAHHFNGASGVSWNLFGGYNQSSSSIVWSAWRDGGCLWIENVDEGQVIEPPMGSDVAYLFWSSSLSSGGNMGIGERAFLALTLPNDSGLTVYGWADITLTSASSVTVHAFAFESTGGSILAGQTKSNGGTPVPGLGGLAALACGAAGLRGKRDRVA